MLPTGEFLTNNNINMKYVIFKRNELFVPVIIPEHATHAEITLEGHQVYSAGFFYMGGENPGDILTILPDGSDSLGVGPQPEDKQLLIATLAGYGMYMFMH